MSGELLKAERYGAIFTAEIMLHGRGVAELVASDCKTCGALVFDQIIHDHWHAGGVL